MALTLRNPQVEALANEVARMAGESLTEAVLNSLVERRDRLQPIQPQDSTRVAPTRVASTRDVTRFLATQVWPLIPKSVLGTEVTKEEAESYLGFGPQGV